MPDHDISPSSSPPQGRVLCCTLPWGNTPPQILSPSRTLVTHSNRIAASAKNFLSKSQRKKRSRLGRRREGMEVSGAGVARTPEGRASHPGALRTPPDLGPLAAPLLAVPQPSSHPFLRNPPAQSQRGQEQHHEDEESVALVHGGPVLTGAGVGGGHRVGAEVRRASPVPAPPSSCSPRRVPWEGEGLPRVRIPVTIPPLPALGLPGAWGV